MNSLCEVIGYNFKDIGLLETALTHSSFANETLQNPLLSYERLEFLGDAVLQIVSSDYLFHGFPGYPEGKLSKSRANLVCETSLSECAVEIGLGEYLRLSKGEDGCGGRNKISILADVVEAIIGAIYLDGGQKEASDFIYRFVLKDAQRKMMPHDFKTMLQEYAQKKTLIVRYELVSEQGPDHDKTFEICVYVGEKEYGRGVGKNKKSAEQLAAKAALSNLKILN